MMVGDNAPPILEPDASPVEIDWLQRAQNAYQASTEYFNASVRLDLERDYRQFMGEHPPGSKYADASYKGRSKLFDPKTRAAIRRNEAVAAEAFFSTDDVVSVTPDDDSDPIQLAGAKMMQFIIQMYLSKILPWFTLLSGAYQEAQKAGVVIGFVHWDSIKQKPLIKLCPPETIRIDPGSDWSDPIGTSPYVIHAEPMYVKDVKARMAEGLWEFADEDKIMAATVPYDSLRQTREGRRLDPKKQGIAIHDYSIVWVHRYIMEDAGHDVVFHTLGQDHLLEIPKSIEEVFAHGQRPYVMGIVSIESFRNYPSGVSRMLRDLQIAINTHINLRIDNVQWGMSKRYFVKRGKNVDTLSLQRPGLAPYTMLDNPADDVKVVDIPDITSSAYQEQDRLALAFDDLAGNFSNASVQSNRKLNETVGGMQLLTTNSNQVGSYQLRTFVETWVEPVLRLMMLCIANYEANPAILTKAMRFANSPADVMPDVLLMQELTLSVNVGMGATNPNEKVNRFMTALNGLKGVLADGVLERFKINVAEVIKELMGNLGYKDGARFFDLETEDPRISQLQNQLQQLQQALDAKHPPKLLKAQVAKLMAEVDYIKSRRLETGVKASYEAMQASQVLASNPAIAPVGDAIMQGAGYQSPNPPGVDPNFPAPALPDPAIDLQGMTTNEPPQPQGAGMGAAQGIETMRNDG